MLQTLTSNVQFWGYHRVQWTKLHPKLGDGDLNSIKVKKLATPNIGIMYLPWLQEVLLDVHHAYCLEFCEL